MSTPSSPPVPPAPPPPPPPPSGSPVGGQGTSSGAKTAWTIAAAVIGTLVLAFGLILAGLTLIGLLFVEAEDAVQDAILEAAAAEEESAAAIDALLVPQFDLEALDAAQQCRVEGGRAAADRDLLYCLDPELGLGLGEALEEARLEPNGVILVFRDGQVGIDRFNELVAVCFNQAPECPEGQLAVVYGDTVISAPTVRARRFERDQVVVSGGDDGWIQQGALVKVVPEADIHAVRWAIPLDGS